MLELIIGMVAFALTLVGSNVAVALIMLKVMLSKRFMKKYMEMVQEMVSDMEPLYWIKDEDEEL